MVLRKWSIRYYTGCRVFNCVHNKVCIRYIGGTLQGVISDLIGEFSDLRLVLIFPIYFFISRVPYIVFYRVCIRYTEGVICMGYFIRYIYRAF